MFEYHCVWQGVPDSWELLAVVEKLSAKRKFDERRRVQREAEREALIVAPAALVAEAPAVASDNRGQRRQRQDEVEAHAQLARPRRSKARYINR